MITLIIFITAFVVVFISYKNKKNTMSNNCTPFNMLGIQNTECHPSTPKPQKQTKPEKPKYKGIVFWHEAYLLPHKDGGYYYRPLVALSEAEQAAMHKEARKSSNFSKRTPKAKVKAKRAQRN